MIVKNEYIKFLTIFETSSLSKAADRLDVQQGALSKVLAKLEKERNHKLFIRSNRGLVPTENGNRLYRQVQQQIKNWENFELKVTNESQASGNIRLGAHAIVLEHNTKVIAQIVKEYPLVNLQLSFMRSPEVTRKVLNYELDFGLVVNPTQYDDLVIKPIYSESTALYAPSKNCDSSMMVFNNQLISSNVVKSKWKKNIKIISADDYHVAARLAQNLRCPALLPQRVAQSYKLNHKVGTTFFKGKICLIYRVEQKSNLTIKQIASLFQKEKSL